MDFGAKKCFVVIPANHINLLCLFFPPSFYSEKSIEDCIKKNCNDFVKYTNWQMLLPYLFSNELLDEHSSELLRNDLTTNHHKGLTFYLEILPSKGKTAYTRFYDCIAKEDQHSGHKTLLELMNKLA